MKREKLPLPLHSHSTPPATTSTTSTTTTTMLQDTTGGPGPAPNPAAARPKSMDPDSARAGEPAAAATTGATHLPRTRRSSTVSTALSGGSSVFEAAASRGCCSRRVRALLYMAHLFAATVGLFGVAVSLYSYIQWAPFANVVWTSIGIGCGFGVALLSVVGCFGLRDKRQSAFLLGQACCVFLVAAGLVVAAVFLLVDLLALRESVSLAASSAAPSALGPRAAFAHDQVLSSYTICCSGCPQDVCGRLIVAPNPSYCSFEPSTLPSPNCTFAQSCSALNAELQIGLGCYVSGPPIPTNPQVVSACGRLADQGIVGSPAEGRCGRGDPATFVADFEGVYAQYQFGMLIGFVAASGALALLCVPGALVLVTCNLDEFDLSYV